MSDQIDFTHGPAQNALKRSANNSASLSATFDTATGVLRAQIEQVEDLGTGFAFWGRLLSADLHGAFFTGTCDAEASHGHLKFNSAA